MCQTVVVASVSSLLVYNVEWIPKTFQQISVAASRYLF